MREFRKKRKVRGAPRIRLHGENKGDKNIRFTSSKYSNVLTSSIYDISETGISFTCTQKLAPHINEVIKLEMSPFSTVHIACLGKVVRIETPTAQSNWNQFPNTVKIGVSFYHMPGPYRRLMSESMKSAFEVRNLKPDDNIYYYVSAGKAKPAMDFEFTWLRNNWVSLFITLAFILGSIAVGMIVIDNAETRKPASSPEWSKNFFQKIKTDKK